jgi:GMP synthase-like glutamine amidotransferase
MKIYYLQHEKHIGPGTLASWAESRNISLLPVELFNGDYEIPDTENADALVVLGGSMNVYQEAEFPFLKDSKSIIRSFIDAGKKVLGICLGGQLISTVLGAAVTKNDYLEIGWWEVQVRPGGYFSEFSPMPFLFHWHGDVFELPEDARLWASTGISSRQAYTVGDNILALQFHPEVDETVIDTFIENDSKRTVPEAGSGLYSQSADEIRELSAEYLPENKKLFFSLLDNFFDVIEGGPYKNTLV